MPNDNQKIDPQMPPIVPDAPIDFAPPPETTGELPVQDQAVVSPPPTENSQPGGSSAGLPPVISPPPKRGGRLGRGKLVAGVLGLLLLVGGVGAGLVLVKQQQDIRNRAGVVECSSDADCGPNRQCVSQGGGRVCQDKPTAPPATCDPRNRECGPTTTPTCDPRNRECGPTAPPTSTPTPGRCTGDPNCPGNTCTGGTCTDCNGTIRGGTKSCSTGTPPPTAPPACAGALQPCESQSCCSGFLCQGVAGSRVCEQPPANFCGTGGVCGGNQGYRGHRCSSIAPGGSCNSNGQTFDNFGAAASYSTSGNPPNCGQADAICVGGAKAGQQCGDFTIYTSGCTGASNPPSNPPPASNPPGNNCPYSSTQAQIQKDVNDPWGDSKTGIAVGATIRLYGFHNGTGQLLGKQADVDFIITKPDGTSVTIAPPNFSSGGQQVTTFTPDKAGHYTFIGKTKNGSGYYSQAQCQDSGSFDVVTSASVPPLTLICGPINTYDTNWNPLTAAQLPNLKAGDTLRLTVQGKGDGNFTKAKFQINGVMGPEVTTKKPAAAIGPATITEYYYDYKIPAGTTTFKIQGFIYNDKGGWVPSDSGLTGTNATLTP